MTVSCNCQDYDGSGRIGDLNTDSFEEIFSGNTAQRFRKELAKGNFPVPVCPSCSELREINERKPDFYLERFHIPNKGIMVENTVMCNLRCLCCDRATLKKTRRKTRMYLADMEKVSEIVRRNKMFTVNFFNLGEPFLSKKVFEEVSILRNANPFLRIVTSTNGMNLNDPGKMEAALLMSHICFSVDGASQESVARYQIGADFKRSYENMKHLVRVRNQAGLHMPTIEWKYVVFPWNDSQEEIEKAIALAKDAEIDVISFCPGGGPPSFISERYLHDPYFKQLGKRTWKGREITLREGSKEMIAKTLNCLNIQNWEQHLDDISNGSISLSDVCVKTIENREAISEKAFVARSHQMLLGRNLDHIRATERATQLASGRITRQKLISEILYSEEFRIRLGTRKGINSVSVGSDMVMEIPCLQFEGLEYEARLKPHMNPDDPDGLYWKLDSYAVKLSPQYPRRII